jgi:hypothetical protein
VNPRAWGIVLDADVFLRSSARDLFLYLGSLGTVDPVWSAGILEEVARNFPGGKERFQPLLAGLGAAYPDALKTGFEHRIPSFQRTDEKDRHVLALASEYEADLVSFNHRHFDSTEAESHGVTVWSPDDALVHLIQHRAQDVQEAVTRAFLMLRKPPVHWADYVTHIRADGMPRFAEWVGGLAVPDRPNG